MESEILDDATTRSLFVDVDPEKGEGQGRKFSMSLDARKYDPAEVTVRSEDGCLVVEAKHTEQNGSGLKVAREFQRRIQLPRDVDPAKLTSTLSNDGILTVQAPVPPRYQAIVSPSADMSSQNGSSRMQTTSSVLTRGSPVRVDPGASMLGRSRSPFLDTTAGRRSPFSTDIGMRSSPVPFTSLAPVRVLTPNATISGSTVDFPVITTDPATGQRHLELLVDLGQPYTADDVVVRVDGRRLTIDAKHETKDHQGRVTTSTTQKQFDIDEQLDEASVKAGMRDDGKMRITGIVKQ